MKLTSDNPIIVMVIYPDGVVETINRDNRNYHMEYMKSLIDSSERLRKIIQEKKIYMPTDIEELRYMLSFELCKKLNEDGLIVIDNLCIDKEYMDDIEFNEFYNIYLPTELTDKQKAILNDLMNDNDMNDSSFGILNNDELIDISYDDVENIVTSKNNSL